MSTMAAAPPPFPTGPVHRKPLTNPNINVRLPPHHQTQSIVSSGHSRTRTTSSGIFPAGPAAASPPPPAATAGFTPPGTMHSSSSQYPTQYPPQPVMGTRRTLSNATSSTSSTTGTPARSNSGALRRSSSARSGTSSPTSYVALMRKQKATVWCDRAQYEDPRMQAQQRAAKMRANMEVAGGPHHTGPRNVSSSSSMAAGVRSKIRHHGAPKASLYAPANLAGTGVPMRLSASEVDENDSEDNGSIIGKEKGPYHHRTGSGRSSLGSGRRVAYANPSGRLSTSSTPPSGHNHSPTEGMADLMEEETPTPYTAADYFEHTKTGLSGLSGGSGSSGERNFGGVSDMAPSLLKPHQEKKGAEDLHRRGSVDERTTTMSNTRLFIANPDLDD